MKAKNVYLAVFAVVPNGIAPSAFAEEKAQDVTAEVPQSAPSAFADFSWIPRYYATADTRLANRRKQRKPEFDRFWQMDA